MFKKSFPTINEKSLSIGLFLKKKKNWAFCRSCQFQLSTNLTVLLMKILNDTKIISAIRQLNLTGEFRRLIFHILNMTRANAASSYSAHSL